MVERITSREQALAYLVGRLNFEYEPAVPYHASHFRLDRMISLCQELGDPHLKTPVIHVAGSKGKGSTSCMIATALHTAGYNVGLYTSPHLCRIEERIVLNGEPCTEPDFLTSLNAIIPSIARIDAMADPDPSSGSKPTFFEILTAMAFITFAHKRLDVAVFEVGMGGRLDSTNVCQPVCTVITSISRDHMAQLGNTLGQIAREKAGIIKTSVPVISGVVGEEACAVIHAVAEELGSEIRQVGRDFGYLSKHEPTARDLKDRLECFYWDRFDPPLASLRLRLLGRHQHGNATVAIATIRELRRQGWNIPEGSEREGVEKATCHGRIEVIQQEPWVLLDTAHNGASMEALAQTLEDYWPRQFGSQRIAVLATTRGKDQDEIVGRLIPAFDTIVVTRYQENPRGEPVESLAQRLRAFSPPGTTTNSTQILVEELPEAAWQRARSLATARDLVCITGSFFLAGELIPRVQAEGAGNGRVSE